MRNNGHFFKNLSTFLKSLKNNPKNSWKKLKTQAKSGKNSSQNSKKTQKPATSVELSWRKSVQKKACLNIDPLLTKINVLLSHIAFRDSQDFPEALSKKTLKKLWHNLHFRLEFLIKPNNL